MPKKRDIIKSCGFNDRKGAYPPLKYYQLEKDNKGEYALWISVAKNHNLLKRKIPGQFFQQMARDGARKMLQLALENEVEEFIVKHSALTDKSGRKAVTKNGYMPARQILTGMGPL